MAKNIINTATLSTNLLTIFNPDIGFQYFGSDLINPVFQISGSGVIMTGLTITGPIIIDGGLALGTKTTAAPYTIEEKDAIVNITSSGNVTLPAISSAPGKVVIIKNQVSSSPFAVTLLPSGADTIDGQASIQLISAGDHISLTNDGASRWMTT